MPTLYSLTVTLVDSSGAFVTDEYLLHVYTRGLLATSAPEEVEYLDADGNPLLLEDGSPNKGPIETSDGAATIYFSSERKPNVLVEVMDLEDDSTAIGSSSLLLAIDTETRVEVQLTETYTSEGSAVQTALGNQAIAATDLLRPLVPYRPHLPPDAPAIPRSLPPSPTALPGAARGTRALPPPGPPRGAWPENRLNHRSAASPCARRPASRPRGRAGRVLHRPPRRVVPLRRRSPRASLAPA